MNPCPTSLYPYLDYLYPERKFLVSQVNVNEVLSESDFFRGKDGWMPVPDVWSLVPQKEIIKLCALCLVEEIEIYLLPVNTAGVKEYVKIKVPDMVTELGVPVER